MITYDGAPTYAVSVMEFTGDLVTHEAQYFAGPFQAPAWRHPPSISRAGRWLRRFSELSRL